jgi:hypothetical protein
MARIRSALRWVFFHGPAELYDLAEEDSLLPGVGIAAASGLGGGAGALVGLTVGHGAGTAARVGAAIGLGLAVAYLALAIAFACVLWVCRIYPSDAGNLGAEPLNEQERRRRELDLEWPVFPLGPVWLVAVLILLTLAASFLTERTWHQSPDLPAEERFDLGSVIALDGLIVLMWIAAIVGGLLAGRRVSHLLSRS